jgi:hypothetical protein
MRLVLLALVAAVGCSVAPSPAAAQFGPTPTFSLDLTPAVEELGVALVMTIDATAMGVDLILGAIEGQRRHVYRDFELVWRLLHIAAAIPTWVVYANEDRPRYADAGLYAAVELSAGGALLLLLAAIGFADPGHDPPVHVSAAASRDGCSCSSAARSDALRG